MKTMKRLLTTLYIVLASLVAMTGCSKVEPEPLPDNDEYYVKYAFTGNNERGFFRDCKISFTTERKEQLEMTFSTINVLSYEVVTGPFKYDSKVYATLYGEKLLISSIQIFVSKNDSPFALKGMTNEGRLEYTIDY